MKKIIILGTIIMLLFLTVGCGKKDAGDIIKELDKKIKLVMQQRKANQVFLQRKALLFSRKRRSGSIRNII